MFPWLSSPGCLPWIITLKAVVKALEQVLKSTEDIVRDEAEKHGKTFSAFGAEIQVKEGALTPDYTHDQVWSDLQASMAGGNFFWEFINCSFGTW